MQKEFTYIEKWLIGEKGIDVGCGTNRLSMEILAIDQQPDRRYSHCDLVHDCATLDGIKPFDFSGKKYEFIDNEFDFIFSSHCLEDFENIESVFYAWWRKLKPDGFMILLLPDMEGGRYAKVGEPNGNPSHRSNVGKNFMLNVLEKLKAEKSIDYEVVQVDTIPHNVSCTVDIVIQKKR